MTGLSTTANTTTNTKPSFRPDWGTISTGLMHDILPVSRFAVNSLPLGGEMTNQAINALIIDFSGADQKGPVYGRTKRSRWGGGKTKYESVIRKDEQRGLEFETFERNTPEEATEALKEGLRVQMSLIEKKKAEPILVPDNDETPDIQMILKEARLSEKKQKRIHRSWSVGDQILTAIEELDLDIDPVADAIRRGKLKKTLLGQAIDRFLRERIRKPEHPPENDTKTQEDVGRSILNMLLVKNFTLDTPLLDLAEDEGCGLLIAFYRTEIAKAGSLQWEPKYRKSFRRWARRFFVFCEDVYHIRMPFSMLDETLTGESAALVIPKLDVIWRFLHTIITKRPELLPFVLLQLFKALRPEEAFRALDDPMHYVIDNRFHYPPRKGRKGAKANTKLPRDVLIRPLTWWLLSRVPGLLDRSVMDFHIPLSKPFKTGPRKSKTGYQSCDWMQGQMNQVLRDCGYDPEGQMPKEILRKICLSALFACKVPPERIAQEASHADPKSLVDYIDQTWTETEGLLFWSMIFSDDQPQLDPDLFLRYRAYNQIRPSPENEPNFTERAEEKARQRWANLRKTL